MITRLIATVVGWYGTETIGDRAILAGIIRLFSEVVSDITINLGSLYPVLSERTLHDDADFFVQCAHNSSLKINLFDSQSRSQLERNIKNSDALIIGGGPLMDIEQMFMLEYAVTYAKQRKKRTIALGCGYGPLKKKDTIECADRILKAVDYSAMRDSNAPFATIKDLVDPAAFACLEFMRTNNEGRKKDCITVNFRDVMADSNQYPVGGNLEEKLLKWFSYFVDQCDKPVYLVPMHTFSIGIDDRIYFGRIARALQSQKVEVVSRPPSLRKTMELFYHSSLCVGMRFHAVLLQTLLNGNNYILDYTHPETGKTISFMRQMNMLEPYRGKYVSLSQCDGEISLSNDESTVFHFDRDFLALHFSAYVDLLNKAF